MNREIDLSVSAYGVTRGLEYEMAILPWGATEPHNLHLPYMTDAILSHDVAVDAAQMALEQYGVRAMVLPPVAMGIKSLKGFQRIHLRPGETSKAVITLDGEAFEYYDPSIDELSTRSGRYKILYGCSSLDKDLKSIDFVVN